MLSLPPHPCVVNLLTALVGNVDACDDEHNISHNLVPVKNLSELERMSRGGLLPECSCGCVHCTVFYPDDGFSFETICALGLTLEFPGSWMALGLSWGSLGVLLGSSLLLNPQPQALDNCCP